MNTYNLVGSRLALVFICLLVPGVLFAQEEFIRGDCENDGRVDIADALMIVDFVFDSFPACWEACDVNDDGISGLVDAALLLNYLLADGAAPASPFPQCGPDPTPGSAPCNVATCDETAAVPNPGLVLSLSESVIGEGSIGQVAVDLDSVEDVRAVSMAVCHDPNILDLEDVAPRGNKCCELQSK